MFGNGAQPSALGNEGPLAYAQLEKMARACLRDVESALAMVDDWRDQGHDLETIYLHGLTPCARLMGTWWSCDLADFAQVSIASTNLQRLMHRLSDEFCAPGADHPLDLSVLLSTEPQSQHTMGAFMLAEFFRRRGWRVLSVAPQDLQDLQRHLQRDWFDALGLSISTGPDRSALLSKLPRLREQAHNPRLCVLVGGPGVEAGTDPAELPGVDLIGQDARETVNLLSQMAFANKS